jgi:hypothetical protein
MRKLSDQGYQYGPLPPTYKLEDEPKYYGVREADFASRSRFLQCLVNLGVLIGRGLTSLRSDQGELYYTVLLKSAEPARVPLGASAKSLRMLIKGIDPALALEDEDAHVLPIEAIEDEQQGGIVQVPSRRRRPVENNEAPAKRRRALMPVGVPTTLVDSDSGDEESRCSVSGRTNSVFIEGLRIAIETHLVPGERGFYKRCIVPCTCANHWDADKGVCSRKRNIDVSEGEAGARSALAFLGVWVRMGVRLASRSAHRRFRPSEKDIEIYGAANPVSDRDIESVMTA